jgi:hypothetical protein
LVQPVQLYQHKRLASDFAAASHAEGRWFDPSRDHKHPRSLEGVCRRDQREGHERFTLDTILEEEAAVLDLVDARNDRAMLWINDHDTAALSADQKRAVQSIGRLPWLVQPLSAPAGAGKTTSMRTAAHRRAPPDQRDGAGARPDRQRRQRRRTRRRWRPGVTHRQSLAPAA